MQAVKAYVVSTVTFLFYLNDSGDQVFFSRLAYVGYGPGAWRHADIWQYNYLDGVNNLAYVG
jgi:hypothetical protein